MPAGITPLSVLSVESGKDIVTFRYVTPLANRDAGINVKACGVAKERIEDAARTVVSVPEHA